ncbi:MAG: ATP-binding cassette domain-containing protein [Verrucomicrobiae bacterium]|nr:ATP-binding cassette domain-containing protein [Verrucomicrobiae bacterium]
MSDLTTSSGVPVIEMRAVNVCALKSPGTTVAVNLDWTVNAGDFWVLAGAQRAGKSDLLMLAAGLMSPRCGTYRLFGESMPDFAEENLAERLRLGFVFDGGQLFSRLTLAENVALPLKYHRDWSRETIESRVTALLEVTGLLPYAHLTPGNVGRNWQKRAGLARALALEPDVLLLDNPLAGLDARHTHWWLRFLDRLAGGQHASTDKPLTLVVTTDDLSRPGLWRSRAKQIACLAGGRLTVFRDWAELEMCHNAAVQELLTAPPAGN